MVDARDTSAFNERIENELWLFRMPEAGLLCSECCTVKSTISPLDYNTNIRGCFFLVFVVQMCRLKQPSDYCQGFLDRFNMAQHGTKQATCYLHYEKEALNIIRIPTSFCSLKTWLHRKFTFLSKDKWSIILMPKTLKIEFQYGTWIPVITFLLYDISIAILVAQSSFYSNSHKAKEMFKMPQMIEKKSIKTELHITVKWCAWERQHRKDRGWINLHRLQYFIYRWIIDILSVGLGRLMLYFSIILNHFFLSRLVTGCVTAECVYFLSV